MGIKLVEAGEPATELAKPDRVVTSVLPKEEAYRLRRQARTMADQLTPWAVKGLVDMARETEDPKLKRLLLLDILHISLKDKSNEEIDPEGPIVDGKASKAEDDALAALENETELGTGDNE